MICQVMFFQATPSVYVNYEVFLFRPTYKVNINTINELRRFLSPGLDGCAYICNSKWRMLRRLHKNISKNLEYK